MHAQRSSWDTYASKLKEATPTLDAEIRVGPLPACRRRRTPAVCRPWPRARTGGDVEMGDRSRLLRSKDPTALTTRDNSDGSPQVKNPG